VLVVWAVLELAVAALARSCDRMCLKNKKLQQL
jgi:hypothetical protein